MNDDDFRWLLVKLGQLEAHCRMPAGATPTTVAAETSRVLTEWRIDAETPGGIKAILKFAIPKSWPPLR